ncbi:hypothetical protein [Paenibacillus sp. 1001270B_150601_E10]|uniref:hypothetical protein n=1 Tax=Paenibacillus sp. 1001270B_150601_E10 TaxID=2787079 RepID=UPI0018A08154|nr:hypothetical protein [Paenibacillus sp. 1001270B_150601_E10]
MLEDDQREYHIRIKTDTETYMAEVVQEIEELEQFVIKAYKNTTRSGKKDRDYANTLVHEVLPRLREVVKGGERNIRLHELYIAGHSRDEVLAILEQEDNQELEPILF